MRIEPLQLHSSHTLFIDYDHLLLLHDEIDIPQALHSLDSSLDSHLLPLSVRNSPGVSASIHLNFADHHPLRDPG